jgi:hypothetical protein
MSTPYQPFLISEYKTGMFNYLEPWIRSNEAFDPMYNAYVYRGTLNKRNGMDVFGQMSYRDNGIKIATGDGVNTNYNGTLATFPIRAGSLFITDGVETFTDNGNGTLTGSAGGTGTIVYATGVWTISFNAVVGAGIFIRASYTYTAPQRPIMGLKTWTSDTSQIQELVAMDTRRASVYNNTTDVFDPLSSISQVLWIGDASTTHIVINTGWTNIAPYSVLLSDGTSTIPDDGIGGFTVAGNFAAPAINYATGDITIDITLAVNLANYSVTFDLQGDYFSGTNANFFNAINWVDPAYTLAANITGTLYMTNNVDFITCFNGTDLSRPPFPITQANKLSFTNDITTCLDIDVYKNRLLIQRPTLVGSAYPASQSIRYSSINQPNNLVADVTGQGGEISAPTDEFIQSSEFLRDQLIVFFTNSVWTFRYTGNAFDPFRWDKINVTKSASAPYATIPYDERITAMGNKGLIACDGVNVQRYDLSIVDQFLDINQYRFAQCFGQRFDSLNQSWMLYPSGNDPTAVSDSALIYNFLENTWSIYQFPTGEQGDKSRYLSCLGIFLTSKGTAWNQMPVPWQEQDFPWNSFMLQGNTPVLLGGGQTGIIYELNVDVTDNSFPITSSITSTQWNPFVGNGQKVQFGYIDFYYEKNDDCVLNLTYFTDNSNVPIGPLTLTLDGPTSAQKNMKRIYLNNIGEFLQIKLSSSSEATFKILGMVLWCRPAGRLTP